MKESISIITRLANVNVAKPDIDRDRVESAIKRHFEALGLEPKPIRWVDDAEAGYSAAWAAAWDAARDAAWAAAWAAARAAAEVAGLEAVGGDIEPIRRYAGIWLPFVDAYEAGLWLFWVMRDEVIAVPRPAIQVKGEQLHCEEGPAVWWPNGTRYYFLNGVRVSADIVETPAAELDPAIILKERNAEVRREIVRKIGIERVCEGLNARCIDRQGEYELLMLDLGDGRSRPYLKMHNPSIGVFHVEGVGPECRTVAEALHWRKPDEMRDIAVSEQGEEWHQQGDVCIWPLGAEALKPYPSILT